LNQQGPADSTMGSALRIEVSAQGAAIIHLASKEAGENSADGENSSEHGYGQQSVGQTLHVLPMAARPLSVSA